MTVVLVLGLIPADPPDLEAKIELPDIVVTPTRAEQPVLETPRAVETVDKERVLELQARSVPEALDRATGVHLQRTNRGAGSPIIRGFVGPQNLIVVDGIRFNTSTFRTGPNQYLALLDPNAIDRLEVVRGSSSVLYGTGAMGGVIQLITETPEGADGFDWNLDGHGRFSWADTGGQGSMTARLAWDDLSILVGGTYDHFGTLRTGGGADWPLSDYDAAYWRTKLRYAPGSWSVSLSYLGMLMRDAGRTDKLGKGEARLYDNDDHLVAARFGWSGGVVKSLTATLVFHRLDELVERYNCQTNADGVVVDRARCSELDLGVVAKQRRNDDRVDVIGADVSSRFELLDGRLSVSVGGDVYADAITSTREDAKADDFVFEPKSRGNFSDGSTYLTAGAYAHLDGTVWRAGDHEIRLNAGLRYSHFDASAPDVPGVGDVSYGFGGVVGSGGIQFLKPGRFDIYLSVLQGFRAPNLQETTVLGNTGSKFEIPNPDLTPEHSDTIELGGKVRFGPVRLEYAAFHSWLSDAIDEEAATFEGASEVDGTPVVRRVNTAEGRSTGVEAGVAVDFWRFTASASGAWMRSEFTDGDGETTPARRVPPFFGTATLRYEHPDGRFYVEGGLRFAGDQDELHPSDKKDLRICETSTHSGVIEADCTGTEGFVVGDVRGGWRFHDNFRADLAVTNVGDTRYRLHGSGYDGPGVDARVTLRARF